jgi:AraC family transcriptional regulator, regulatory protein of adaptative response / methylated-DNA-[protein]-cysteine methyltransferase
MAAEGKRTGPMGYARDGKSLNMTATWDYSDVDDMAWEAISNRDRRFDGKFVYAAVTTSIYCRPSCPARHPHRRNALILPTAAEAEERGFIACRRCHPDTDSLAPVEQRIKIALSYIKEHFDQTITLDTLSQASGVSPNHLQQTFKRIVGLSPKVFCDAQRLSHLRRFLSLGESVSSAGYNAGYGSSRALYEKATKSLGMTPATYQHGGDGIDIHYASTTSALGRALIAGTAQGICAVLLGENEKQLIAELHDEFPKAIIVRDKSPVAKWILAVKSCQSEDPLFSRLPIETRVEVFQAKIWKVLQ